MTAQLGLGDKKSKAKAAAPKAAAPKAAAPKAAAPKAAAPAKPEKKVSKKQEAKESELKAAKSAAKEFLDGERKENDSVKQVLPKASSAAAVAALESDASVAKAGAAIAMSLFKGDAFLG